MTKYNPTVGDKFYVDKYAFECDSVYGSLKNYIDHNSVEDGEIVFEVTVTKKLKAKNSEVQWDEIGKKGKK